MNKTVSNSAMNYKQYGYVIAVILMVLLTSCPVKGNIKTLTGLPINTEQGFPKGSKHTSTIAVEKCAEFQTEDTTIIQKFSLADNDVLPLLIFTVAVFFVFNFRLENKEDKHPVYSDSGKIQTAIPLFLEYKKLIIHYTL
ncbi:hypothetical protein [Flavobacterium sp. NKUCC04_CG]|uniref:hypothetical protein n=1 Tax=Flavobacterium sp. NKUCC04_CG TaxID=2842121 RepID=UPI001C5A90D6|nr:hypothetical protein [Flavobacterium sp. NKUCC04_CG]MBW3518078.1 hypothetical protein [Flavobacterium sp. NKUCC04_CG]